MSDTKEADGSKVGLCQYAFSEADVALYTSLFDTYRSKLIGKIFPANVGRNIVKITCDSLKKLGKSLNAIGFDEIKKISADEFKKCTKTLGNQKWTTAKLEELGKIALTVKKYF